MSAKERTYYSISCDVCGEEFTDSDSWASPLFDSAEAAAEAAREYDWAATLDGHRVVCDSNDADHTEVYEAVSAESDLEHKSWKLIERGLRNDPAAPHGRWNWFDSRFQKKLNEARMQWLTAVREAREVKP